MHFLHHESLLHERNYHSPLLLFYSWCSSYARWITVVRMPERMINSDTLEKDASLSFRILCDMASRGLLSGTRRSLSLATSTSKHLSSARLIHNMASKQTPSVPRPSASLIVINPRNEILFVHRNPKSGTFAGMHVCPLFLALECYF